MSKRRSSGCSARRQRARRTAVLKATEAAWQLKHCLHLPNIKTEFVVVEVPASPPQESAKDDASPELDDMFALIPPYEQLFNNHDVLLEVNELKRELLVAQDREAQLLDELQAKDKVVKDLEAQVQRFKEFLEKEDKDLADEKVRYQEQMATLQLELRHSVPQQKFEQLMENALERNSEKWFAKLAKYQEEITNLANQLISADALVKQLSDQLQNSQPFAGPFVQCSSCEQFPEQLDLKDYVKREKAKTSRRSSASLLQAAIDLGKNWWCNNCYTNDLNKLCIQLESLRKELGNRTIQPRTVIQTDPRFADPSDPSDPGSESEGSESEAASGLSTPCAEAQSSSAIRCQQCGERTAAVHCSGEHWCCECFNNQ